MRDEFIIGIASYAIQQRLRENKTLDLQTACTQTTM